MLWKSEQFSKRSMGSNGLGYSGNRLIRGSSLYWAIALAIGFNGADARAEIALMTSGKILHIEKFERSDNNVTLFLDGGGEIRVPSDWVANIVPDEIVDRGDDIEEQDLLPGLRSVILQAASTYELDPNLIAAVIWTESSGDPNAVSKKGAGGLMQLMPATAKEYGVSQVMDPKQNVDGGVKYLRKLLDQHQGDLELALAAYNAGPGAVARYGGIPPYRETQHYVKKVLRLYQEAIDTQ